MQTVKPQFPPQAACVFSPSSPPTSAWSAADGGQVEGEKATEESKQSCRKNERSLFESDLTKWHRTDDAVYRIVAKPSIQSTASL